MPKRVLIFVAFYQVSQIGALGISLLALYKTRLLGGSAQILPMYFWIALITSLVGLVATYMRLKSPAEQLSWTEREFRALRHLTDKYIGAGLIGIVASIILVLVKFATSLIMPSVGIASVPLGVFGWMILGSVLLFIPSYLLDIWRLDNLGQMLGWDRSLPKN